MTRAMKRELQEQANKSEARYAIVATINVRIHEDNKQGFRWLKHSYIILEGETIEEVVNKAHSLPAPDDIDIEAMSVEGIVLLPADKGRKDVSFKTYRQF